MKFSSPVHLAALAAVAMAIVAPTAQAQQFSSYSFDQQNRAQIAVAMKQIEDSGSSGSVGLAGSTTIVCGGGSSTATANNTCIILNSSTGQVATDQLSDGDQSSRNSQPVTLNGETISGADEVLSTLTR